MGKQHYMTYPERVRLETLLKEKRSVAYIAGQLGFSRQTIYNEIKRGLYRHDCGWYDEQRYSADRAQQLTSYRQAAKGRPLKIGHDHRYAEFLEHTIADRGFSPAAALAEARAQGCYKTSICTSTLYSYIEKRVFRRLTEQQLWVKRRQKKKEQRPENRIAHPKLPSIEQRPAEISLRQEYGHWEMDLIVSAKGGRSALLTLTERLQRKEIIRKLPDRRAETVRRALDELERQTPDFREKFKSITTDNGSEFMQYEQLRRSIYGGQRFQLWYCHSYAAWEKGSNENHNRMIRRFFPKGTNFDSVSEQEIQRVQDWLNSYPRKILNWKSPDQTAG